MDEATDGSAAGMMLLDAESVDAELMNDDTGHRRRRPTHTGGMPRRAVSARRRSDFALVRR